MITRRQAWMKLAVMIADGMPDPREIDFHPDMDLITIIVDTTTAYTAWGNAVGASFESPFPGKESRYLIYSARRRDWHGFTIHVTATSPLDDVEPATDDEDLVRVREIAEEADR